MSNNHIIHLFILLVLLYGCKVPQQAEQKSMPSMPKSFQIPASEDTTSSGLISWKQFFKDKYLINIIDTALNNNWDLMMAMQRIQAAKSDVLLTQGGSKPFVNGVAAPRITRFGEYTMDGAGNKTTEIYNGKIVPTHLPDFYAGFQASWEIDAWGKWRNRKKAATARFLSSIEGKNIVITNLIAEIANAYFELLALDQTVKILDETIAIQENALEMVRIQKEAAVINELAVKQFESQLINFQAMRLEMKQRIIEMENSINFLAAKFPQTVIRDSSYFVNPLSLQIRPGLPSSLLQNRPDIRQVELELAATKADVMAAKAAFYPSINITGGIGLQAFKPELLINPVSVAYSLLGNLTMPLINRSAIKAEFNYANAVQLEALYNYHKVIVNGYVEVYNEMLRIENLQQIFELKRREVDILTQSINISTLLFRTARANYLEVLLTQQNSLNARLNLVDVKRGQLMSTVNLYRALGGGWQ